MVSIKPDVFFLLPLLSQRMHSFDQNIELLIHLKLNLMDLLQIAFAFHLIQHIIHR